VLQSCLSLSDLLPACWASSTPTDPRTLPPQAVDQTSVPSLVPTRRPLNNSFCSEAHSIFFDNALPGNLESALEQDLVFCEAESAFVDLARGLCYVYRGEDKSAVATTGSVAEIHVYTDCRFDCFGIYTGSRGVKWSANLGINL
jgi:hypothetical protein